MTAIDVGHNIFVGPREACSAGFDRVVHLWRDDYPANSCAFAPHGADDRNLVLHYRDGESLETIGVPLDQIAAFFSNGDRTLVHCAAGQTRSPTIALIGKLVRGSGLRDGVGDIVSQIWFGRGLTVNLVHKPLQEILRWASARGVHIHR